MILSLLKEGLFFSVAVIAAHIIHVTDDPGHSRSDMAF